MRLLLLILLLLDCDTGYGANSACFNWSGAEGGGRLQGGGPGHNGHGGAAGSTQKGHWLRFAEPCRLAGGGAVR